MRIGSRILITCVVASCGLFPETRADVLKLNLWGSAGGYYTVNQSVDVTNGFNGLSISLPAEILQKSVDGLELQSYVPISTPFGDLGPSSWGLPFQLHATLTDSTLNSDIAEISFTRSSQNDPISVGLPDYLSPGTTAATLPFWFTGLSAGITTNLISRAPNISYVPTLNVSPGQPPLESPVPEPSTLLIFACGAIATGLTRRKHRQASPGR